MTAFEGRRASLKAHVNIGDIVIYRLQLNKLHVLIKTIFMIPSYWVFGAGIRAEHPDMKES